MAREAPEVAVVGSLNMDLVVSVPHHPSPGETVLGGDYFRNPGGKGANQAVAAARLGRDVAMVGRVGHDDAGQALLFSLRANDVDPTAVVLVDGAPTGIALITVDHRGENAIVVSPGANRRLTAAHVETAAGIVRDAAVTLLQLEIPMDAVIRAARLAGGVVVLNPAPAPAEPPPHELMAEVDVLVPNLGELATLAGAIQATSLEEVEAQAKSVGVGAVVVTLGSDGALVLDRQGTTHVPAPQVEAVDTTAAGDAFCGALADALVRGQGLAEAARWAVHAAAIACTRPGAQASLPTREEVEGSVADR